MKKNNQTDMPTFPGRMHTPFGRLTWEEMRAAQAWDKNGILKPKWRSAARVPLLERLATAWRTLGDDDQAGLLLRGPLPLWMQEAFEREAERLGEPVSSVIFHALSEAARAILAEQPNETPGNRE